MATDAQIEARLRLDRRRYQREVERLLEQIRSKVRELRRLDAAGARGQALREAESELATARRRLARLVSGEPYDGHHAAA